MATLAKGGEESAKTQQFREFKALNIADARTAIEDGEFSWLENVIPIGKGNLLVLPPAGANKATVAAGIATMWGTTLNISGTQAPVILTVNNDGSISQLRLDTFALTTVAAAGTVTTSARMSNYADKPMLIIDPTKGYFTWDGISFISQSATRTGTDIVAFESRVWITTASRTVTFSAPNSFTDFTVVDGGNSTTVSDSAFPGQIFRLLSALEQLWLVGPGAVDAISNVATAGSPLVTTFNLTNIVSNVGTTFPSSVTSFFRTFIFLTQYGVYAVVGATPQKLSDKLDNFITNLTSLATSTDQPSAIFAVNDIFVWCVLVTYKDPVLGNRPLLMCFSQGKWFFASPQMATTGLTWITGALVNGQPQLWGTDGTNIFQMFGGVTSANTKGRIQTKLYDHGDSTQIKAWLRYGLEFTSSFQPSVTVKLESESGNQVLTSVVTPTTTFLWTTSGAGGVFAWTTSGGAGTFTWIVPGIALVRANAGLYGRYLGMTIDFNSQQFILSAFAMEYKPAGKWNAPLSG